MTSSKKLICEFLKSNFFDPKNVQVNSVPQKSDGLDVVLYAGLGLVAVGLVLSTVGVGAVSYTHLTLPTILLV